MKVLQVPNPVCCPFMFGLLVIFKKQKVTYMTPGNDVYWLLSTYLWTLFGLSWPTGKYNWEPLAPELSLYSLNVKRVKWLLFKRVESVRTTLIEWKSPSKRVKIIPKRVKITPKRVKITPKEWISLLGGSSLRDSSFVSSCPSMSSPKKWNSLFWSDFHSFWGWFSLD